MGGTLGQEEGQKDLFPLSLFLPPPLTCLTQITLAASISLRPPSRAAIADGFGSS